MISCPVYPEPRRVRPSPHRAPTLCTICVHPRNPRLPSSSLFSYTSAHHVHDRNALNSFPSRRLRTAFFDPRRLLFFSTTYKLPNLQALCFDNDATVPRGGYTHNETSCVLPRGFPATITGTSTHFLGSTSFLGPLLLHTI